jgi:hypothetical protein
MSVLGRPDLVDLRTRPRPGAFAPTLRACLWIPGRRGNISAHECTGLSMAWGPLRHNTPVSASLPGPAVPFGGLRLAPVNT